MISIHSNDFKLNFPGFYNIYPIENEISNTALANYDNDFSENTFLLDDFYGRLIKKHVKMPYGDTARLDYYYSNSKSKIIDFLRVPFRKIPIFQFTDLEEIKSIFNEIESANPTYEILLRGQTKLYTIERPLEENMLLYGEQILKEPSLLPSFLRNNFNEYFIYSLWHSQLALMLNDVGVDLSQTLTKNELDEYYRDVTNLKNSHHFTPNALGTAQHYGLPSIGLDLTKNFKVAAWFASNKLNIDIDGNTKTQSLKDFSESTIFIFRCPKDSVFSHNDIKPKFINNTRPDRQDAWFSQVGWGFAKNQLASYLVCGVRLNESILNIFESGYEEYLFPDRKEDLVLNYFLDAKENPKYKDEVKRALKKIYFLK